MIWIVKQLISTGFCIQIIKGQKCPKPAIVAGGLFQTGVLPLYHDCTFQSYFTRFWSSNVRDYPLAVEWCHETNEFGDDYLERIYANSENGCGDVIYYVFTWQVKQMNTFLLAQQQSAQTWDTLIKMKYAFSNNFIPWFASIDFSGHYFGEGSDK